MNNITVRCLPSTNSNLNSELRKKTSRKRHRNKFRSSNLKKKRLKKFHCKKKSSTIKSHCSKFEFMPKSNQMMSNWYWSNYRKAVEWQEKHRTAYWKAYALTLLEENNHLVQIINHLHPDMNPEVSVSHSHLNDGKWNGFSLFEKFINLNRSRNNASMSDHCSNCEYDNINVEDNANDGHSDGDETNDNIEFEMSAEMMEFFQQSFKHKMELKELKEKQILHSMEDEIKQMQTNKTRRAAEMNQLYGDGSSMIIGMETAVQLSFEKFCDIKSPKFWPNIPFRL